MIEGTKMTLNIEQLKTKARHSFGKGSLEKLVTGHDDLQLILNVGIWTCPIDFGLSQLARTFDEQLAFFLAKPKRTSLDPRKPGVLKHAKHVITEWRPKAEAADIYIYHPNAKVRRSLIYDKPSLSYVMGHLQCTAELLYQLGMVKHKTRWGGNWDRDGVILQDQSFDDLPHIELVAA